MALPVMKAVRQAVSEFSANTSIHGVRYIAENGRRWVERCLWIVTEVVCITSAVYMLMSVLFKFQDNPTMTRVDSYFHEVATIPFPAVTLCNVNRIFYSRAQRLAERLKVPGTYDISKSDIIEDLPLLGELLVDTDDSPDLTRHNRLDHILTYNNLSAAKALEQLGQPCEELLERCSWEGRKVSCSKIFRWSLSPLGVCCSFNSMVNYSDDMEMTVTNGGTLKTPFFGYPLGLTVLLNPKHEDYMWGPFASAGVVCYVHDSMEPATERSATTMVSIEREVMVQILPSIRNATPALRSVTPERRRCLFDDEYPQYPVASGYENCLINCEGDRIWKTCGCRPLTLPHVAGGRGKPCGLKKLACLARFYESERNAMLKSQARGEPTDPATAEELSETKFQACGCLAQCDYVIYDLEATTADFKASRWVRRSFYKDMDATGRSLLHIYYDSETAALLVNDLVSDPVQLMSSLGGIFSLFLGCSFMSGVELLYFFTVRLWMLVRGAAPAILRSGHASSSGDTPDFKSPSDKQPNFFTHRSPEEGWGWGTDKPVRPRVF